MTIVRVLVACACLLPLALVAGKIAGLGSFGPNAVEEVLHAMGRTGLNLLWITLAITPVRKLTRLNRLVRLRRMLGLFAFFYALLHLLTYAALDLRLDWDQLRADLTERPYIMAGMSALLMMVPLAATSTKGWQRRLGRGWTRLHRGIYPIGILVAVHFWWQTKADVREPLLYAAILAALLGFRVVEWRMGVHRRSVQRGRRAAPGPRGQGA